MTTRPDRGDADRESLAALLGAPVTPPDAEILAAVHEGLESVPAGSPTGWFDVPRQRTRAATPRIRSRRTT